MDRVVISEENRDTNDQELHQKHQTLDSNIESLTNLLKNNQIEDAFGNALNLICTLWNCDKSQYLQTSLQVLFMLLKHKHNDDVTKLLSKLVHIQLGSCLKTYIGIDVATTKSTQIPEDLEELKCFMQEAANKKRKIKAVSTNFSGRWTDIGDSKESIIDTSRLKRSLQNEFLKSHIDKKIYSNFEAGTTMTDIQNSLWPSNDRLTGKPEEHRVLENVTSGAALSLAGTVSTGAHGNGLNNGIVADAVVSFQVFTIDSYWKVKRYQIEPSDGITDPIEFAKNNNSKEFELIQKDDVFNASVVNIGCIGVVYSYVLLTSSGFCLEEVRKVYKWSDAKKEICRLYKDDCIYNFQVIGSPYAYKINPNDTEEHRVLISVLRRADPPGVCERPGGHSNLPMESIDDSLVAVGESTPEMVPILMHYSLMYLEHDKVVLNAVDALNTLSGIVKKEFCGVTTSECAMRSEGPETVIEIMEDLHELYHDIRRSNNRQLVNVPIALRFTAKTDKNMAMEYDGHRPTVTIEQSIIDGTFGADDTLRKFRKRMFKNFQGRPHWGLLHELDAEKVKRLYDKNTRTQFITILNLFDPNFVFENDFARRVFGKGRRDTNSK